mmetsp:Transcript_53993/g.160090  ORF Transcript_53993/g.160090 Transcript_53993/m.160090 type:complete len:156 (-) Transcript_53993:31-498(-)
MRPTLQSVQNRMRPMLGQRGLPNKWRSIWHSRDLSGRQHDGTLILHISSRRHRPRRIFRSSLAPPPPPPPPAQLPLPPLAPPRVPPLLPLRPSVPPSAICRSQPTAASANATVRMWSRSNCCLNLLLVPPPPLVLVLPPPPSPPIAAAMPQLRRH